MPFPLVSAFHPFPRLDRSVTTLEEWFHPISNDVSVNTASQYTPRGFTQLGDFMTLARSIGTADNAEEIAACLLASHGLGSSVTNLIQVVAKAISEALPEAYKWLSLFIKYDVQPATTDRVIHFRIFFKYPTRVSYNECSTDSLIAHLRVQRHGGNTNVTDEDLAAFKAEVDALNFAAAYDNIHHNTLNATIYNNDSFIPSILRNMMMFLTNTPFYYPANTHSGTDWMSVTYIREQIAGGATYTVKANRGWNRVDILRRPGVADRSVISRVLNYSSNVLDYLPYNIRGPKEPKATLYGVELEACGDYHAVDLISAQKDLFFICKQDGSIRGAKPQKYELVTVPASLKAHKRLWAEFFEKIDYTKFDTTKDTGNGMHVHIDRSALESTKGHVNRLTWFFTSPSHQDFIFLLSERPTKSNLLEWASFPNHFAQSSKVKASKIAEQTNYGIRGAVHFKGTKTVEIRVFKGIVSYATVVKNLEFVDSVVEYTRVTALSQLNLSNYIDWLKATPKNKYTLLKEFLAETKLDDVFVAAQVTDYLWSESNDYAISEKLNKAPFKITNAHITTLNKKRRKRTFIIKNGKVICVANNGGLLAKLDKTQQKKQTRGAASFRLNQLYA